MGEAPFVFTDEMDVVSNHLWAYTSAVGSGICFLVLLVIAGVGIHPVSRPFLDRVSFRLLIWALATNTIFGVANVIGGLMIQPGFLCGFSIFVLQLTLELSSFLTFCIALNMQLVVVHHLDGRRFERYYIIGSILLACALTVPPYALKQYGWDPLVEDCWYANDNQKERLGWQIGTQLVWTVLTVLGELGCSAVVVIYMLRYQILYKRSMQSMSRRSNNFSGTDSSGSNKRHANLMAPYRDVILRIVLYPMASCIVNGTSVGCVINATANNGVHSWSGYRVLLLSDFLYGGRAIVYGLLAATDPSLMKAIRALKAHYFPKDDWRNDKLTTIGAGRSFTETRSMPLQIELSTIVETTHDGDRLSTPDVERFPSDVSVAKSDHSPPLTYKDGDQIINIGFGQEPRPKSDADVYRGHANSASEVVQRRQTEIAAREAAREEFSKQI